MNSDYNSDTVKDYKSELKMECGTSIKSGARYQSKNKSIQYTKTQELGQGREGEGWGALYLFPFSFSMAMLG